MVVYAYAATYPREVKRLALVETFLPGVAGWEPIYDNPHIWLFRFYGPTLLALVRGRERLYFNYLWNDFAAEPHRSIPEINRIQYTAAYARPARMAAGFAQNKLAIPVPSIAGMRWITARRKRPSSLSPGSLRQSGTIAAIFAVRTIDRPSAGSGDVISVAVSPGLL
jgi:pimeloyl-ACP methyl ester carboxylesterase